MNYYRIRTLVRVIFWGTVAAGIGIGLGELADAVDTTNDNPCDVSIHRDFTWTASAPVDLTACDHPVGIDLLQDGRWEWEYRG
jgi:hypothetical protein